MCWQSVRGTSGVASSGSGGRGGIRGAGGSLLGSPQQLSSEQQQQHQQVLTVVLVAAVVIGILAMAGALRWPHGGSCCGTAQRFVRRAVRQAKVSWNELGCRANINCGLVFLHAFFFLCE